VRQLLDSQDCDTRGSNSKEWYYYRTFKEIYLCVLCLWALVIRKNMLTCVNHVSTCFISEGVHKFVSNWLYSLVSSIQRHTVQELIVGPPLSPRNVWSTIYRAILYIAFEQKVLNFLLRFCIIGFHEALS
jgi:hypothetical protein